MPVVLREYAYYDRQLVIDFLSSIEDGISESHKIQSETVEGKLGGELAVPGIAKITASAGTKGISFEEMKTSTDASLFQRLYIHLQDHDLIKRIDKNNIKKWKTIEKGDILEIDGILELSIMENTIDLFDTFMKFATKEQRGKNFEAGVKLITLLKNTKESVNVKISVDRSSFKFISNLLNLNTKTAKQNLNSNYTIIGRVQQILQPGDTYELFSLVPGLKLKKEQLDPLIQSFRSIEPLLNKTATIEDFRVTYPGMIITPIVIFR